MKTLAALLAGAALSPISLQPALAQAGGKTADQLAPRGTPAASDLIPCLPNGGAVLEGCTVAGLSALLTSVVATPCNGLVDDTLAIQAALNSGLAVQLPPGVCVVSSPLLVESYRNNGQTLKGAGSYYSASSVGFSAAPPPGTTVIRPTSAMSGKSVFIIDGTPIGGAQQTWVQGFGIENLAIDMVNTTDESTSVAIEQIQAFDIHYSGVRVMNDGASKRAWLLKAGAFTTHLSHVQGDLIDFEGTSSSYAVTTIDLIDADVGGITGQFYQNVTFYGGSIQAPYRVGSTPISYLAAETAPYRMVPNTGGLYVATPIVIRNSLQFMTVGTDWEAASEPSQTCTIPSSSSWYGHWAYGTYNDGTHGCLPIVMTVEIEANASNTKLIAPTLAGEYPFDQGVNTQIDAYGGSIHNATEYFLQPLSCANTIVGFTDLAQYLDYGSTTTFNINCLTGVANFPKVALRPATDGAILTFQNAAGATLGYVGTSGTPEISWSGLLAPNQILSQPTTDGSNVFLGENAEGVQLFNFSTNASAQYSQFNFANGLQLNFYSDNYATLTASIVGGVGMFANGVATPPTTYANLPGSPVAGQRELVSDATSCTFGSPVSAGGSTYCPVIRIGSSWVAG
ncbi:MAG TPA: hypothetical protein VGH03_17820 [Caulobacteraceae bacterium]|jgi:hypothetical protein